MIAGARSGKSSSLRDLVGALQVIRAIRLWLFFGTGAPNYWGACGDLELERCSSQSFMYFRNT